MKKFNKTTRKKWSWGHCGYYNKIWCDSSWELAFLVYNCDHNIPTKRNLKGFSYTFYNKKHKFYPDFIVNDTYIEIKGKMSRKDKSKIKQFKLPLIVIGEKEIQQYLNYVKEKHGDKFFEILYK